MSYSIENAGLRIDPLDPDKWAKEVLGNNEETQKFKKRVEMLDLRDVRANILFSRRIERLRDFDNEELFMYLSRIILEGDLFSKPRILHVSLGLSVIIVLTAVKIQSCSLLIKCTLPRE